MLFSDLMKIGLLSEAGIKEKQIHGSQSFNVVLVAALIIILKATEIQQHHRQLLPKKRQVRRKLQNVKNGVERNFQ